MHKSHKINAVTPAGRKEYLEILEPYVIQNRPLFDQWIIWVNTPHEDDIAHIESIKQRYPDFVTLVYSSFPLEKGKSRPQPQFFKTTIDKNTVYIKFDDDICWVAPDAVEKLVDFRLENRKPFFVMANTVMNGFCAYLHAKYGAQDFMIDGEFQRMPPEFGNKVWSEVPYAEYVHRTFLNDWSKKDLEKYKFDSWILDHYQRVAINCIAWMGSDFADFGGVIDHIDEELWMCCIKARDLKRPNVICGSSLVAHYAFYKHRKPFVVGKPIDTRILKAYKYISATNNDPEKVLRILNAKTML